MELSGGSGSLKEIDYQDFKINAAMGKNVKVFALTSETVDDGFRERLAYFTKDIEDTFFKEIDLFLKTGNQGAINELIWEKKVHEFLLI
jgi:hypothetical protein